MAQGHGHLQLVSSLPEPGRGWEESRTFWQPSLPLNELFGPVLYHSATVKLSVTRDRHWPIRMEKGFMVEIPVCLARCRVGGGEEKVWGKIWVWDGEKL